MSDRKPQDVIERCSGVVHRAIQERATADEKWHWGVVLEEMHRARASEKTTNAQILALQDALLPFAKFAYHFNAAPLRGTDDAVYSIHGGEGATVHGADLRLSDCRKALTVLAAMGVLK